MTRTTKLAFIVTLALSIIYTFWLQRRPLLNPNLITPAVGSALVIGFKLCMIIPFYAFIPLFAMETKKDNIVAKCWRSISKYSVQLGISLTIVFALLGLFNVPGVWWTWMTMALMSGMMSLLIVLLDKKVSRGEALVLAIGVFSFVAGFWEIPYQTLATLHAGLLTAFTVKQKLINEITTQIPILTGGIFIVAFYVRKYKLLHFTKDFVILLALYITAWLVWLKLGFYLDFTFKNGIWTLDTPPSNFYFQSVAAKGSKAILNFIVLATIGGLTFKNVKQLFSR